MTNNSSTSAANYDNMLKQLFAKQELLNKRLYMASTSNMSHQVIDQLHTSINEVNQELMYYQSLYDNAKLLSDDDNGDGTSMIIGE